MIYLQEIVMDQVTKAKEYVAQYFEQNIDPQYEYHNLDHTLSVVKAVEDIAREAQLSDSDARIVRLAALFHDTGFVNGAVNHEERSAALAEEYLSANGVDSATIEKIKECILATKMNTVTSDYLCQILQDADMSGLASSDYLVIAERLRRERNSLNSDHITKIDWDKINIEFIRNSQYRTAAGKALYQAKKEHNLEALIAKNKKRIKKRDKALEVSIADNKSAQTQFKTALRNHIDLSNIADNKANIMISVNALILTVALPFLVDKSIGNPIFWLPTIILSAVCLSSMIYATLATRPIKMTGHTTIDQIRNNSSNLFFFGNYHKMSYEEYKTGVEYLLGHRKALDDSIIRDLFFLGKSLGAKFGNLRLCYNIFMYGISVTVLSLLVVYFI